MGVTTKKNIAPIIIGDTTLLKIIPNLNQSLLNGKRIFEFNKPNIKKINDKSNDHNLISPLLIKGYKATNIKTTKNTIPKLRLELILISSI